MALCRDAERLALEVFARACIAVESRVQLWQCENSTSGKLPGATSASIATRADRAGHAGAAASSPAYCARTGSASSASIATSASASSVGYHACTVNLRPRAASSATNRVVPAPNCPGRSTDRSASVPHAASTAATSAAAQQASHRSRVIGAS